MGFLIWLLVIGLHGKGGVHDLYCSHPPGGDQNVLASPFRTCAAHFLPTEMCYLFWEKKKDIILLLITKF